MKFSWGTGGGLPPKLQDALKRLEEISKSDSRPSQFKNSIGQALRYDFSPQYLGALRSPIVFTPQDDNQRTFFESDNKHSIQSVAGAYQGSIAFTYSVKKKSVTERTVLVFGDVPSTFWNASTGTGFYVTVDTSTVRVYKRIAGVNTLIGTLAVLTENATTDYIDLSCIVWTLSDPMQFMVSANGVYLTFSVAGMAMASGGYLGLSEFGPSSEEVLYKPAGLAASQLNALSQDLLNVNLDGIQDGTTYKKLLGVSAGLATTASINDAAIITQKVSSAIQAALGDEYDNLVKNAGGEQGTVGSQATSWTYAGGANAVVVEDFVNFGSRSIKIASVAQDSYSSQDFTVLAGQIYELSGWIKTDAHANQVGRYALLNIDAVAGVTGFTIIEKVTVGTDPATTAPDCGLPLDGTTRDWTFVRCRFKPTGADGTIRLYIQVGYGGSATATARFDGVKLRRLYSIVATDISVAQLSAITADVGTLTAGLIQNSGATAGIRLSGTLPGTWTRYLDLAATGSAAFLHHDLLDLNIDGTAKFKGQLDINKSVSQTFGNAWLLCRDSTNVAHGMTSIVETDIFGGLLAATATAGGMNIIGLTETDIGLALFGLATTPDTVDASYGVVSISATKKSGTTDAALVASDNALLVYSKTTTLLNLKGDGTLRLFQSVLEVDGSATLPSFSFKSDTNTGLYSDAADRLGITTGGVKRLTLDVDGVLDSYCLSKTLGATFGYHNFHEPNVAHGITGVAPTDVYGFLGILSAQQGGLLITGLTETTIGIELIGVATTGGSSAPVTVVGQLKSGTGVTTLANTDALFSIQNNTLQVFRVAGNGQIRYNFTGVRVTKNTQSVANATETAMLFTTEDYDTDAFHDTGTNTGRLTVPSNLQGKYLVTAMVLFHINASVGDMYIRLRKNGATNLLQDHQNSYPADLGLQASAILDLAAGDYIELMVFQNNGGSRNVDAEFQMTYLGA